MPLKYILIPLMLTASLAGQAHAEGDAKAGKSVFKKCKACHTVKDGKNKVGPTLFNIVGAPSASVDGFRYSKAMTNANLTWDVETLRAFLTKPKDLVPGTSMAFAGLKKQSQIDDLIAFLIAESAE